LADEQIEAYRDLRAWQEAMTVAADCYRITQLFPREEAFGMTSQIRRSAASVAANIAEGWGRDGTGSFVQFLKVPQGSLKELETHLLLSERVGLSSTSVVRFSLGAMISEECFALTSARFSARGKDGTARLLTTDH
jgi:four helix bundle protein